VTKRDPVQPGGPERLNLPRASKNDSRLKVAGKTENLPKRDINGPPGTARTICKRSLWTTSRSWPGRFRHGEGNGLFGNMAPKRRPGGGRRWIRGPLRRSGPAGIDRGRRRGVINSTPFGIGTRYRRPNGHLATREQRFNSTAPEAVGSLFQRSGEATWPNEAGPASRLREKM